VITDSTRKIFLQKLYRLFSFRQRSEKEIRDYFITKNYQLSAKNKNQIDKNTIEELISILKEQRLIDDLAFAKNWIESRSRKKGIRVIKSELVEKGIDRQIIEELISSQSSTPGEEQTAHRLLEKKIKVWENLPALELRKKAYDFLLRRGFEYETVKFAVEKIIQKE
jgi:regulatory protein